MKNFLTILVFIIAAFLGINNASAKGPGNGLAKSMPNNSDYSIDSSSKFHWDGTAWSIDSRSAYSYETGKTIIVIEELDGTDWLYTYKLTSLFDSQGREIESITERYVDDWVNYKKITTTYENNHIIGVNEFSWNGSAWVDLSRTTGYQYDINYNLLESTNQSWVNGAWTSTSKTVCTYSAENKVIDRIYSVWYNNDWLNNQKNSYTYENNLEKTSKTFTWSSSDWVLSKYEEVFYNGSNNEIKRYAYSNVAKGATDTSSLITTDYDIHNNETQEILETWVKMGNIYKRSNSSKLEYKYKQVNNVIDPSASALNAYPNPANDFLSIEIPVAATVNHIRVFDACGVELTGLTAVECTSVNSNQNTIQITVAALPEGVYFYELNSDKLAIKGKFIVVK